VHYVLKQRSFAAALSASSVALCVAAVATLTAQSGTTPPKPVASHQPPAPAARPAGVAPATTAATAVAEQTALVKQYCVTCHNDRGKDRAGSLTLASFDAANLEPHGEVAEKVIRKLRAGMMPPPGARRPDASVLIAMAASFEARLDKAAALNPNPGSRPFQRLNRVEYQNAVRDLLNVDVDVTAYLPPDTISHGFDNVADSQTFSPTLMDGYLRAASQISRLAVGDRQASATTATYKISRSTSQMRHIEGAPMGTRGGIAVTHTFPADGHYTFKMSLHYEPLGGLVGRTSMSSLNIPEQVEVSVDGQRVALFDLNTRMSETDPKNGLELVTPPVHVKAGPQKVAAAFIQRLDGPIDDLLMPLENTLADVSQGFGVTMLPHLRDFAVVGPSDVTGVSDTPSRLKVFSCRPTSAAEEESCAAEIVKKLSAQAFRGAPTAADLQDALNFYEQGRKKGGFEAGIRLALQSILMSPRFLFRLEQVPSLAGGSGAPEAGAATRVTTYRITDDDLASRLSFFLWGTLPDAELLKAAATGALRTSSGTEKQVRRMLADKRSSALSTRFASQWLRLQDLDKIHPDYLLYPQYDDTLAAAMAMETELFFDSVVREDRSVLDLLTADYSFVNERLAIHYRIPNIIGSTFQRVPLPPERRGLLGHGSILTLTSVADRTSPVQRGKWVMEVLLGTPPPPPPPDVPTLDDSVKATEGGKMLSTRERMEMHRKNPSCNSCHRVIDPLGLALENFDVTGAWRIKDNEVPVDVVGDLYDGTRMEGPAGLRAALLNHSDMFLRSFTESLLTYAVGRRTEYTDMPAIRGIVRDAAKNQNRISSFILGVVNSPAFRMSTMSDPVSNRRATDVAAPQNR
jgi:mono/diheme cytochrome c family protein